MNILGIFEEFFSETVYPNRYPVGIVLLLAIAAAVYLAWRLRWHKVLWDHKYLTAAIGAPALLVASLGGYYTLSPLWQRSTLCEDNPLTRDIDESTYEGESCDPPLAVLEEGNGGAEDGDAPKPTAPASSASTPTPVEADGDGSGADGEFEPHVVGQGTWRGADEFHFAEGIAKLIESEPGRYIVRVEEFSVRNGPDLFVYLSTSPDGYGDGSLNLGALKATDGAFNYEVPEGTDIEQFASVVVWCRQFSVLFGTATLQ
jgi:hypothetical protein